MGLKIYIIVSFDTLFKVNFISVGETDLQMLQKAFTRLNNFKKIEITLSQFEFLVGRVF